MSRLIETVQVLTIPNGNTVSNEVEIGGWLRACSVFAPTTLPETVSIQMEPTRDGATWRILQSGGADVTVPAGRVAIIMEGVYRKLRLSAATAVAADRVFHVCAVVS